MRLTPEELLQYCDPDRIPYETTAEADVSDVAAVGQERALRALEVGVGIRGAGFHLFVVGPPGSGKHSTVLDYLERNAAEMPAPDAWCYVPRLDDEQRPRALRMPAGRAHELKADLDDMVKSVSDALPKAFESEAYTAERSRLEMTLEARSRGAFDEVRAEAAERGLVMLNGNEGVRFVPAEDGRPMEVDPDTLPDAERAEIRARIEALRPDVDAAARYSRVVVREARQQIEELNRETARREVDRVTAPIRDRYANLPDVVEHMDALADDILDNLGLFLPEEDMETAGTALDLEMWRQERSKRRARYKVNVLSDPGEAGHAPVVYEAHPTLGNLIGRVEYRQAFGALSTDFSLIRPGALHRANGGFLVVDADGLLKEPFSWEALKRALRIGAVRLGPAEEPPMPVPSVSLDPDPVPLDVKVVLVGDPELHHSLSHLDPEVDELFKVIVEFGESMPRTEEGEVAFARAVAAIARQEETLPVSRHAVARLVELAARLVDDGRRLTSRFSVVSDLIREADFWARREGADVIAPEHVDRASEARIHRSDMTRELLQEQFTRDVLLIATQGRAVGQVNGMTVFSLGEHDFGMPTRITARVRVGGGEVVDIEREVELGGPLHSKGVLILGGLVGSRYVTDEQLAFAASLTFEQSAVEVDGDSASLGELLALLSSLADVPLAQSVAVTGAISQAGQVQPVGAVNAKIEGFFDVCAAKGLTGDQGVVIPRANVQHLMLRDDVVEAVREGRFSVYAVSTVDEAIELLSRLPAGSRDASGAYPRGSFNRRVEDRLRQFAEQRRRDDGDGDSEH